jgi:PAS domain S-box-containing protein
LKSKRPGGERINKNATPTEDRSVLELETLAAWWLGMAQAKTLDEIESAALASLVSLTGMEIAYTSRREAGVWTITGHIGLIGNPTGVAVPEEMVPYADALRAGQTICYESPSEMGPELAAILTPLGLASLYAVPIMKADKCVGGLAIARPTASTFNPSDRALVQMFASHLSTLAQNRELAQSLEALAESVPVIVLRTDPNGWINWYNRRWYEFTGQTREEAAGWGWQTAHHPEDFLRVMEEWPKALATGQRIEIEFRLRRYDGPYHWHLARVEPVRDDKGNIISWYGTVVDIENQKQALERTKRAVEAMQQAFLPAMLPTRPTLQIDATYVSAEEDARVGGDWYDAFELADGRLGFSIGDVAGHGFTASMAVGTLRQSIFTLARLIDDPARILREVNRILHEQNPGTLVTALVGFIDPGETTMRYATAGHPPPIVAYHPDKPAMTLPTGGPPLGVVDDLVVSNHVIPLEKAMVVALYTDGITEHARDVFAGEAKLISAVSKLVGEAFVRPALFIYDSALEGSPLRDDAALLVFHFSEVNAAARHIRPGIHKQWRFHASDAKASHVARREVGVFLRNMCGDTDATFESELIVGELLANTVEHAPGLVHLIVEWTGEHYVLVVRDSGPGLEQVAAALPSDPMNEGNRGLFLIGALSSLVEVVPSAEGGAELRVVLPLRPISG